MASSALPSNHRNGTIFCMESSLSEGCSCREHVVEPVVAGRHALLHAGLDDRVAGLARFVAPRLRERGPSTLLDEDEGVEGLARIPGVVEPLGADEPLGRFYFAVDAAHPHLRAVGVVPPHPA